MLGVLLAAALVASAAAADSGRGARGRVVGTIERAGGVPPARGKLRRPALGGEVSVFSVEGRLVARERVQAGHRFQFLLRPGQYWLNAGSHLRYRSYAEGCAPVEVRVRRDAATRTNVYIDCGAVIVP